MKFEKNDLGQRTQEQVRSPPRVYQDESGLEDSFLVTGYGKESDRGCGILLDLSESEDRTSMTCEGGAVIGCADVDMG